MAVAQFKSAGELTISVRSVDDAVTKGKVDGNVPTPIPFVLQYNTRSNGGLAQRSFPSGAVAAQWLTGFGAADVDVVKAEPLTRGFVA